MHARSNLVRLPVPSGSVAPAAPAQLDCSGLVAALRRQDPYASGLLFDRYARLVRRVLARVLGPDPDLHDAVHDVFVAALESIHSLQQPEALPAWLTQIAVNFARVRIRSRIRARRLAQLLPGSMPDAVVLDLEQNEIARAVYRTLDRLRPDERIAFALRFIGPMQLAEVAEVCGVSVPTVKRRLARAKSRFAKLAEAEPSLRHLQLAF